MLGATTLTEYRKYIEKDPALERRFRPVTVEEPSAEETLTILGETGTVKAGGKSLNVIEQWNFADKDDSAEVRGENLDREALVKVVIDAGYEIKD